MSHQLKNKHLILNIGLAQSDNSNQIQTNVTSLLGISFTTLLQHYLSFIQNLDKSVN